MGEPVDTLKQASEVLQSQCAQLLAETHRTLNNAAQDLTVRVTNPSYAEYLNSTSGKIITEQREQIVSLQSALTAAQQRIADLEAQCARVQGDANRYAWLRDWHTRSMQTAFLSLPSPPWVVRQQIDHGTPTMCGIHTTELDVAIDAAMAAKGAG